MSEESKEPESYTAGPGGPPQIYFKVLRILLVGIRRAAKDVLQLILILVIIKIADVVSSLKALNLVFTEEEISQ